MNINIFLFFISIFLAVILFAFKPLDLKQEIAKDIPLFNILEFTMYEFNTKGLVTFVSGTDGIKYPQKYIINDIDYTDNSRKYIANMKADDGVYKDDVVRLNGNVVYSREDGLTFETKAATYDKKTNIYNANGEYILYKSKNVVTGIKLKYDNIKDKITSKRVVAKYQVK